MSPAYNQMMLLETYKRKHGTQTIGDARRLLQRAKEKHGNIYNEVA